MLEMFTFYCNQSAKAIKEINEEHLSLVATITIFSYSFLTIFVSSPNNYGFVCEI